MLAGCFARHARIAAQHRGWLGHDVRDEPGRPTHPPQESGRLGSVPVRERYVGVARSVVALVSTSHQHRERHGHDNHAPAPRLSLPVAACHCSRRGGPSKATAEAAEMKSAGHVPLHSPLGHAAKAAASSPGPPHSAHGLYIIPAPLLDVRVFSLVLCSSSPCRTYALPVPCRARGRL